MDYDPSVAAQMGDVLAYPWLYEELFSAIVGGELDGAGLLNLTGQQLGDEGDDSDLRMLWRDVFPGQAFPARRGTSLNLVAAFGDRGGLVAVLPKELTKTALVAYMRHCPVVLSARTRVPDKFDPNNPAVPLAYYSDGRFVWSAETVAYVDRYGAGLPQQFLRHVANYVSEHGDTPPDVPAELLHEATEMLKSGDRS